MLSWNEWLDIYGEDEPTKDDSAAEELALWELEILQTELELLVGAVI